MPASAGSVSSTRGSRPVARSSASAVALPPIQESSVPPGTSRAAILRASVTTRTPSSRRTRSSVSRVSGSSPRSGASLRSTIVTSTPRRLSACANSHAIGPAPPTMSEAGRSVRSSRSSLVTYEALSMPVDRARSRARPDRQHGRDAAQLGLAVLVVDERAHRRGSAPCPRTPQHVVLLQQPLVEAATVADHAVQARHDRRAVDLDRGAHAELVLRAARSARSPQP